MSGMKHILMLLAGMIAMLAAFGVDARWFVSVYWGLIAWYWMVQIEG